ncbi:MAG: hypothetical protein DRJ03_22445 [Chloroflexi bacterium]|nr:MAG: hypothetical protein DRJ03_22445 [Chloroflexota bacterium]
MLKLLMFTSTGSMFMGVWNPSASGYSDTYSRRISDLVFDRGFPYGIEGEPVPYRCRIVKIESNVEVPEDAVIFNSTTDTWEAAYAGETAPTYVRIECDRPYFHDGHKLSATDVMYSFAFEFEWTHKDSDDDPYYDETEESWMIEWVNTIKGIKLVEQTDDTMVFDIYHTYSFPPSEILTGSYVIPFTGTPWQLWYAMSELVAHNEEYSWSEATETIQQLDQINPDHAQAIKEKLLELKNSNPIPEFLKPYIEDENAAKAAYDSIVKFIEEHNHAVIGNGPYILDTYKPENLYVRLVKFDKWTPPKFAEGKYAITPYFEKIEVYATQNQDTGVLQVAKGEYDIFWYPVPAFRLQGLSDEDRAKIHLVRSVGGYWDMVWNPVHDKDNPYLITVGDKKYFNPFALREVRFALQYLINRNYIVQNILKGSGAPMYVPFTSGEVGYQLTKSVVDAFGLDPQGDEEYALQLIEEAMNKAAKELEAQGYILKKIDGKWYFGKKEEPTTSSPSSTESPTTSSTESPTETETEEGGICGPAALVGLALIPLLLKRKK